MAPRRAAPLGLYPACTQSVSGGCQRQRSSGCPRALQPTGRAPLLPDLRPRIAQCAQSLRPPAAGERAQRETTLLRWPPALGAAEPGWGLRGHTSLWPWEENQGERGQGRPANKGLGFVLEKTTEKDQVRAPNPSPDTHAYSDRGARHTVSRVFPQSQKNPRCSRVFCLSRQYTFHIHFLKGLFLNVQEPAPQERTLHAGGCGCPPNAF